MPVASLFRRVLLATQFLHRHGWLHGDIKPQNIGITGKTPQLDVLLDLSGAKTASPDEPVQPTPGHGGTVRYLAPEQEMIPYTQLVDVWALGVIGFELTYGYHPWHLKDNSWRPGNEHHRSEFKTRYDEAIAKLQSEDAGNEDNPRFMKGAASCQASQSSRNLMS